MVRANIIHPDAAAFLDWIRDVRHHSPNTVRTYGSALSEWSAWWPDQSCDPTLAELEAFTQRPRRYGRAGSPATVARDIIALRSYWKWRVRQGLSGKNVAADLITPKLRPAQPRAISDETWITLWNHPDLPEWERPWLGLGYFCGLRRAEIVDLRGHHLSVEGRKLVGFTRKGGGDHTVPVGVMLDVYERKLPHLRADLLWPALERAHGLIHSACEKGGSSEYALCGFDDTQQLQRQLGRVIKGAGVPRFTAHCLRHSAVTNLLRAGVPLHLVSRMANHTSTTTTMRYVKAGGLELSDWLNGSA